jgi:hypothetical protein
MSTIYDRLDTAGLPDGYADILMDVLAIGLANFLSVKDALFHFRSLDEEQAAEVMQAIAERIEPDEAEEA